MGIDPRARRESAPVDGANALLARLAELADGHDYEGFLSQVGAELGLSPTRVSRALRRLRDSGRVELLRRGHGHHTTRLRIADTTPLRVTRTIPVTISLADRLLDHLQRLSRDGVVERHLVDVARELGVGAPSVSRALGQLTTSGRARVEQVGTRSRPTRIELTADAVPPARPHRRVRSHAAQDERLRSELDAARTEIQELRTQLRQALGTTRTT